jgi:hypothetical protein
MEGLVRLVAESLERHGMHMPPERIEWSAWMQLESRLCLSAPSQPGLFVIAERVFSHGLAPNAPNGQARLDDPLADDPLAVPLVVLKIGQAKDLGFEMGRLCSPYSPLYARVATGRCMVRFAAIDDAAQGTAAHTALQQWFSNYASTTNTETSTAAEFPRELAAVPVSSNQHPEALFSAEPQHSDSAHKRKTDNPAPLPSGF